MRNIFIIFLFIFYIIRIYIISKIKSKRFLKTSFENTSVGEEIRIKKTFFWNGEFQKKCPITDICNRPWYLKICKDDYWEVVDIIELDNDWLIYLVNKNGNNIHIKYFESHKYWETKSDIRDIKLRRLGIN